VKNTPFFKKSLNNTQVIIKYIQIIIQSEFEMSSSPPPIKCLIVDLDFIIRENEKDLEEPVIRIRGKTKDNQSIIIHVTNFYPYFYIDDISETTDAIQGLLYTEKKFGDWIKDNYQLTKYRYYQNKPIFLYTILGRNPWRILKYSRLLQDKGIKSYENDISYTSRFLIDSGCKGLNWIIISNYEEKVPSRFAQVFEVKYKDIEICPDEPFQYTYLSLGIVINSIKEDGKKIQNFSSILKESEQRIVSACVSWGKEEGKTQSKHFILEENTDLSEKRLLENLVEEIHIISPEVIITFNGNRIILPYIITRMEKLGIDSNSLSPLEDAKLKQPIGYLGYRIPGYITYDLVKSTRWLRTKSGKKGLTDFAEDFLGVERIADYAKINELWFNTVIRNEKASAKQLEKLCPHDSQIIHSLFFAMGMEEWLAVMKLVGIRPSEGVYSTPRHLGEFQLFRNLYQKDTIIPAEPSRKELAQRKSSRALAIGGFVLVPKGSLHEAVLIADFRSMFPSIMVAYNIGGESYNGSVAKPTEKFHSKPETGLRIMLKDFLDERKDIKKQIYEVETYLRSFTDTKKRKNLEIELKKLHIQSNALKVVANSLYGSHNYVGSRFYDTEISNAITSISKEYIKKVDQWTQEYSKNKCQVIYGDTDSLFIKLADRDKVFQLSGKIKEGHVFSLDDVPEAQELLNFFRSKLPKEMDLEFVDLALRIVFAPETKKRYSYVSVPTGDLKIVGFEAIRRDTSPFARDVQTAALKFVLEEGDIFKARQAVIDMCLEFIDLKDESLLEKTTILGPIRRNPKDYKSKTPAIGALEDYSRAMGLELDVIWKEYERFPFIIIQGKMPLYKRSKHPSLVEILKIDKDHYMLEALRDVKRIGVRVELKDIRTSSQKTLDFSLSQIKKNNEDV